MNTTPRHPTGIITPYTDALGRSQKSVTGPKAHILITRDNELAPFRVAHSDQLAAIAITRDAGRALGIALTTAGIEA